MLINLYTLLLIGVTVAVVLSRRTMYAILILILLFALVAVFVYSLGVDFIGLIFVIVYVGAIATLFLFIVMMLGGEEWEARPSLDVPTHNLLNASGFVSQRGLSEVNSLSGYVKHILVDLLLVFGFGLSLLGVFSANFSGNLAAGLDVTQASYDSNMFTPSFLYGVFFYDHGYLPFLLAGVVLFIAMLGSIVLTTRLLLAGSGSSTPVKTDDKKAKENLARNQPDAFAKIVEAQKLEFEMPVSGWLSQLTGSAICVVVGFLLKDFFIVSTVTRGLYISVVTIIYLTVSFKMSNYLAAKRLAKKSRKS